MNLSDYLNLQPKQQTALQTLFKPECKYLLYGGAMAGGKSFVLRWAALLYLIFLYQKYKIPNIPVGLFSEDYPTLKDRQISRIKREFPKALGELKDTRDEGLIFLLDPALGQGRIMLRNLDDPAKYMSTEFAGEFVEELTRNTQQTFEDLRNRLRYPGIEEVKFMGATNPGGVGHGWVKSHFIDKYVIDPERDRFFYVHANAYDNQYINPDYLKQLESLPEQKKKAYLYGSWDVFAGQVFTEFRRDLHVIASYIPIKPYALVAGMDWGRSAPFSFHVAEIVREKHEGQTFYRAKTFLEVYGTEKNPREWALIIKERLADYNLRADDIERIQADPAMFTAGNDTSISIADQFKDAGITLKEASNDRLGGWALLHEWLSLAPDGHPYWQMTANCHNLVRTLPELVYDELKTEDVDTDGEDHCLRGNTLIHTTFGKKRISDLIGKEGYLYGFESGINRYFNVRQMGISKIYRIYFENGIYVDATSQHPFLSITGEWIPTTRLTSHDLIQCLNEDYCTVNYEAKFQRLKLLQMRILLQQTIQKVQWFKKITQRSMDISSWRNSPRISYPPQGQQSRQQSNRKFGIIKVFQSFIGSFTNFSSKTISKGKFSTLRTTKSNTMAQIETRFKMAQGTRTTHEIKIKKIIEIGSFPVYNLEVENTQCFAVNGGILVHNSPDDQRYMFKHLKHPGEYVGGVKENKQRPKGNFFAPMTDGGQQLSINPAKFTR